MNFWFLSVLFVIFQSAVTSNVTNFIEIILSHDNSKKNEPDLSVERFDNGSKCQHRALKYMEQWVLSKKKTDIVCQVKSNYTNCFCSPDVGNCFDFNNILEVIYSISRDEPASSVPYEEFHKSGNSKSGLGNITRILKTLHTHSSNLSTLLHHQRVPSSPTDISFDGNCTFGSLNASTSELQNLTNRGDLVMKVWINQSITCLSFFSRGTPDLYNTKGSAILRIRERMMQEINFHGTNFPDKSAINISKTLQDKFGLFLEYARSQTQIINDPKVGRKATNSYFDNWDEFKGNGNLKIRGIICCWILIFGFLVLICAIIRSSWSYEPIEERKPLKPHQFRLKDIEKELKRVLSGKHTERGSMTVLAKLDLEKALKSEKQRQKRKKGQVYRSIHLPTPKEASDLESFNRKNKVLDQLNLEETQQDVTEFIGTAVEPKLPKSAKPAPVPPIPTATTTAKNEKSVPSRTDQGTFVNKEKSDEVVRLRSIQKTQSPTPEFDAKPVVPPKVFQAPQSITPHATSHGVMESKRTRRKRSTSKSESPGKVNRKRSKMASKDKNQWYRFWN